MGFGHNLAWSGFLEQQSSFVALSKLFTQVALMSVRKRVNGSTTASSNRQRFGQ